MSRIARSVACASLFVLFSLTAVRAMADPVNITSGFLVVPGATQPAPFSVSGTRGFSAIGRAAPGEGRIDPFDACFPCLPGSVLSVGGNLTNAFVGTATLDDQSYDLAIDINAPTVMSWEFVGSAIAPPAAPGFGVVEAPFTLTGSFFIDSVRVPLRGRGTASVFFTSTQVNPGEPLAWNADLVHYNFFAPAAVPEPTSLALLGSGVLLVGIRRQRQHAA